MPLLQALNALVAVIACSHIDLLASKLEGNASTNLAALQPEQPLHLNGPDQGAESPAFNRESVYSKGFYRLLG